MNGANDHHHNPPSHEPNSNGPPINMALPITPDDSDQLALDDSHGSENRHDIRNVPVGRDRSTSTSSTSSTFDIQQPNQCLGTATSDDDEEEENNAHQEHDYGRRDERRKDDQSDIPPELTSFNYSKEPFAICARCLNVQIHHPMYAADHIACLCIVDAVCCSSGFATYLRTYPDKKPVPLPRMTCLVKYNLANKFAFESLFYDDGLTQHCQLMFDEVQQEFKQRQQVRQRVRSRLRL